METVLRGNKTVLVVEDNPDHLEFTTLALRESRIAARIDIAQDGAEAIDYLFGQGAYAGRDPQDRPALVLLDLKLPKLTGHDVLKRMRSDPRSDTIPVVVLTSSSEAEDIVASYRHGANGFVRKPVDFERFTAHLRHVQAYWLEVNETA